jgi:hypothetical protein
MLKNYFPKRTSPAGPSRGRIEKERRTQRRRDAKNTQSNTLRILCAFASLRASLFKSLSQLVLSVVLLGFPVFAQTGIQDSLQVSELDSAVAVPQPVLKKRNPTGAAFRSLAIPGWGQYYNGQKIKAALAMAAELGEIGTAIYWNMRAKEASSPEEEFLYKDYRNQAFWFLAGTIVLSMLDAYVDAHLSDFDEGPSLQGSNAEAALPPDTRFAIRLQIRL